MAKVLKLLQILEKHRFEELDEENPVGGHGAGVCFRNSAGKLMMYKVGKTNSSPAKDLSLKNEVSKTSSRIVLGHVRHASSDFMDTIEYPESTQPYKINCLGLSQIVCAHNGKVRNYAAIRSGLSKEHYFQSDKVKLVDSEVIPHLFEENLKKYGGETEASKRTLESLEGNNAVILLSSNEEKRVLHILHKGRNRGMHVWRNDKQEIILCSREKPLQQVFGRFLKNGGFEKVLSIEWREKKEIQQSYKIATQTFDTEEKLREVTIQTQITWAVLLFTFLVGLVELLPELKIYNDFLWLSVALCVVYLTLAAGLSYGIIRFSIATLFVLEWRRLLPKEVRDKVVYLAPLYERILFDKNQNLRRWIIYLCSLLSFIFWCIILVGKMLVST